MASDDFVIIDWTVFYARICTSLSDEAAAARLNSELPTGVGPWTLITDLDVAPVQCQDSPQTHRHMFYGC